MIIQLEGSLLESLVNTLSEATTELAKCRERKNELRATIEANELLNEAEAEAYLKRDSDTLRYYRTLGLSSFKKGADRWYLKGEINSWHRGE